MTNAVTVTFGYAHPFWPEALELRKTVSNAEIARIAKERGYDLSYRQITYGLSRAPISASPGAQSLWLRRKYANLEKNFNVFESIRDLAQDAIARAGECQDELDLDDTITPSRRQWLEMQRDRWLTKAFDWGEKIAKLEVQVTGMLQQQKPIDNGPSQADMAESLKEALLDFQSKLPTIDQSTLSSSFGGDNIKLPEPDDKQV